MGRRGKRNPKKRWQQVRVSKSRGRIKIARRNKRYEPGRWGEHKPKINPHFKLRGKSRGAKILQVPKSLLCDSPENYAVLLRFITELKSAALHGKFKRLVVDFRDVEELSPEGAVTLVAEIQRCRAYCRDRTKITGTYPRSHDVAALLSSVGFFKALNIADPSQPADFRIRTYVQIERGNRTTSEVAWDLLDCFGEVFEFEQADRRRLHVALVESMDNVNQHAYPLRPDSPDLLKEWWLAGYADHEQQSICFIFYDQGAGIPTTIRTRQRKRILERLSGWSDARWIQRAVEKGVSRLASKRRGHGLVKLREFIAELDVQGTLSVVANKGMAVFGSDGGTTTIDLVGALDGTLVVWQLRGIEVQSPESTELESSDASAS